MSNSLPVSPTDFVPPPSYQISQEEFDQKTSQAVQLLSSTTSFAADEGGWPVYNAAAFETRVESYEPEHSPPATSSAGIVGYGADSSRPERQEHSSYAKLSSSTHPMNSKNPERRRRSTHDDPDFHSEHRVVTPPPPFTPTGPSLDGPPFEEVVRLSYNGSDSPATSPLEPRYPPQLSQPVAPLRVLSHRFSDPQTHTVSSPHPSYRSTSIQPAVPLLPNPTSTITRVEFDPQMAYSPYGGMGNHASNQAGATAFYNHAVASHLPTTAISTQLSQPERVSSPYSSGYYSSTPYWSQQATPSMTHLTPDERYTSPPQHPRFSTPVPSTLPHPTSTTTTTGYDRQLSETSRGPLPPAPLSQPRWTRSETQLV